MTFKLIRVLQLFLFIMLFATVIRTVLSFIDFYKVSDFDLTSRGFT